MVIHADWEALALGRPSYPPYAQAGAQDGAVIAIPAAVRLAMQFGARARPFRRAAGGTQCYIGVLGTSCAWCLEFVVLVISCVLFKM